jgi:hypothetical protein
MDLAVEMRQIHKYSLLRRHRQPGSTSASGEVHALVERTAQAKPP